MRIRSGLLALVGLMMGPGCGVEDVTDPRTSEEYRRRRSEYAVMLRFDVTH
jgi:hypothetical protein